MSTSIEHSCNRESLAHAKPRFGNVQLPLAVASLLGFAISPTFAAPPVQFSVYTNYVLPDGPISTTIITVAITDLNQDEKPDFLASYANASTKELRVFLGNGDGSFVNLTNLTLQAGPSRVITGDWNEDGNADVATASSSLGVMFGSGDGYFFGFTNYVLDRPPNSLVAADFNGDNHIDLAATKSGTNTVSILLGNGNGYFSETSSISNLVWGAGLSVDDLNRDQKLDLVVSGPPMDSASRSVRIHLGNGDGTFETDASYVVGRNPGFVAVSDFNNDQLPDVVTANASENTATILFGAGDGTFTEITNLSTVGSAVCMAMGDFNGDGNSDIALATQTSRVARFLLSNGDKTFHFQSGATLPGRLWYVAAADINSDHRPDLLFVCKSIDANTTNSVAILLNESSPVLEISLQNNNVLLSWPDWPDYHLQLSTSLTSPTNWIEATGIQTLVNGRRYFTNSIDANEQFYRLGKP